MSGRAVAVGVALLVVAVIIVAGLSRSVKDGLLAQGHDYYLAQWMGPGVYSWIGDSDNGPITIAERRYDSSDALWADQPAMMGKNGAWTFTWKKLDKPPIWTGPGRYMLDRVYAVEAPRKVWDTEEELAEACNRWGCAGYWPNPAPISM